MACARRTIVAGSHAAVTAMGMNSASEASVGTLMAGAVAANPAVWPATSAGAAYAIVGCGRRRARGAWFRRAAARARAPDGALSLVGATAGWLYGRVGQLGARPEHQRGDGRGGRRVERDERGAGLLVGGSGALTVDANGNLVPPPAFGAKAGEGRIFAVVFGGDASGDLLAPASAAALDAAQAAAIGEYVSADSAVALVLAHSGSACAILLAVEDRNGGGGRARTC
jgi:hypothetical protein